MFIEISREVVTFAERGNSNAVEMLSRLALAIKYRKHIVFAGLRLIDRILMIDSLDKNVKAQYMKLKAQYSYIGSLVRKIDFHAVVLMRGDNRRTRKRILIDATKAERLEIYEECHLLTENLQDGEFYEYLVHEYTKGVGVGCPICYMPQMGGGNTMATVYHMEIDRRQHFCLAIIDSDKKWPTEKKGRTWEKVREVDGEKYLGDTGANGFHAFNCSYYVMEKVREMENLIPLEVLRSIPDIKDMNLIKMSIDMSYHDMKEGLLASKVVEGDYQKYLQNVYSAFPQIISDINFCAAYRKIFHANDKKGYEEACKKWKIVEGVCSKVMSHVLHNGDMLKTIDFTKLTLSQQIEWTNIGRKIFEWCCQYETGIV